LRLVARLLRALFLLELNSTTRDNETRVVCLYVRVLGNLKWSPEQIAEWLKHTFSGSEDYQVSHKSIYCSLLIQARGPLREELLEHLRRTRVMRQSSNHTQKIENHGRIKDTVSISQ
jgi:IS30 family transposase